MTTYVFECDICHGQIRVQNERELTKCGICGKKLCVNCNHHGLCQADVTKIPIEDQEILKQIDVKYDLAKAQNAKKIKKIMLIMLGAVLFLMIWVISGSQLLYALGPEYFGFSFLALVPLILVTIYMLKVLKQYPLFDTQRKAEQGQIVEKTFPPSSVNGQPPAGNLKICSNCGQALQSDAKFCDACGQKVPGYSRCRETGFP